MIHIRLFWTFFKAGVFSFGGGYAMLSMIQQDVVEHYQWLPAQKLTDIIAISQMMPGPIAINVATFVGYEKAGFWGSILTTFAMIFPSLILMSIITLTYMKLRTKDWFNIILKDLRPLVIGLIVAAAILIGKTSINDFFSIGIFVISLFLLVRFKLNPILVMVITGLAGYFIG